MLNAVNKGFLNAIFPPSNDSTSNLKSSNNLLKKEIPPITCKFLLLFKASLQIYFIISSAKLNPKFSIRIDLGI